MRQREYTTHLHSVIVVKAEGSETDVDLGHEDRVSIVDLSLLDHTSGLLVGQLVAGLLVVGLLVLVLVDVHVLVLLVIGVEVGVGIAAFAVGGRVSVEVEARI